MNKFLKNQKTKRLKQRMCVAFACFCFTAQTSFALGWQQPTPISGTVTDAQGALPGVTVLIKGTAAGTLTDATGRYSLQADATDTLVFSYLGYKTVETAVGTQTVINIQLEEDTTQLQEVVLNAGYYTVKDKERTGSIASVTSQEIGQQPVNNVLAAMQGRMTGVNIIQTSGVPGGGFEIEIRGRNSLRTNGNNPLYIIDGVPYSSDPIGTGITSPIIPTQPSPLNSINPELIERIEVLKDADATAIYGSRGANGVVLITTKKGKAGKTTFTATLSQGIGTVANFIQLMNTDQYLAMRQEAYQNDGIEGFPADAFDLNGSWDASRNTDWQKTLYGNTAQISSIQTALSGGNAQTQYLLSSNFNQQGTVFPGDFDYRKANFLLNVSHASVSNKFKSNLSVGYTMQDNLQPSNDLTQESLSIAPNAPALYDADGNLNWENSTFNNPLRNLVGNYTAKTYDFIANGQLSYALTPSLTARTNLGMTHLNQDDSNTAPYTQYDPAFGVDSAFSAIFVSQANRQSWIIEPQLDWKTTQGKNEWSVLAGATFQSQKGSQLVQYGMGFSSNSLIYNLGAAATLLVMNNQETAYQYQAFYGRINWNHDSKYILNLTGRRDGSSRFGPGKQFATFGAVGAAWVFSKEAFLSEHPWLSFGKLRATYGVTGSDQIGDYQYLDTYATTGQNYQGVVGMQPTRLFNPAFAWETNKKFEVALEMGFLNDRIFLSSGWYSNRSSNQLIGVPLPGTTGFNSIQANLNATIENTGTEIGLRTVNMKGKDFSWESALNLTFAQNELRSFPGLEGSTFSNQFVIGEAVSIRQLYQLEGVNPETGIYEFKDLNGDGVITAAGDRKVVRDFTPDYFGGVYNQFQYKNWQFDFLFQFVKQINFSHYTLFGTPGNFGNQPTDLTDRWQQPGDVATFQQVSSGSNAAVVNAYDRFLESTGAVTDASFVRLKNIALSWTVPQAYLRFATCRLQLQAQNLLTFTKYKGIDPEFRSVGYLPPLRVISAGMQLTF